MLNNILHFFVLASLLFSQSCASILSGTTDTIYVRSTVPGTKLFLNKTEIGQDEGSIKISKKRIKHARLSAVKDGCRSVSVPIETMFDKTSLLGLFLDFGVVSILIIDWGTYGSVRKAKKINYVLSPVCEV